MREYTVTIHETGNQVYVDYTESEEEDPAVKVEDGLLIMATLWASFRVKGVSRHQLNKWLYDFEENCHKEANE